MEQIIDIFRFATVGCLILLILQLWRSKTSQLQAIPAIAFCTGVLCYLLVDWEPLHDHAIFFILLAPAFVTPFSFWLFSKSLFDDKFTFGKWMLWVMVAVLIVFYLAFLANWANELDFSENLKITLSLSQQALGLLFVVLAIVEASRNRESDLILSRLQFRNAFILMAAILITLTILAEVAFRGEDAPLWMEVFQKGVIAVLTFYFAMKRLSFRPGFFDEVEKPEPAALKPTVDLALVKQLTDLIEDEKYYQTEGLTIRLLSEKLNVKEYRLRQTINQHLGFRNFNDYLNSYRIQEACQLLKDPKNKELTILEIAYAMGFNSLAPFNKAFKETTGLTPTEWRKGEVKI